MNPRALMECASRPVLITGTVSVKLDWWERQDPGTAGLACCAINVRFTLRNSW